MTLLSLLFEGKNCNIWFRIQIKIIEDEQKHIDINKRICSAKFGFIQKAAGSPPLV
jgi:hypothetical protein